MLYILPSSTYMFDGAVSPRPQNGHIQVPAAVTDDAVDADVNPIIAVRRQHADGATVGVGQAEGESAVRRMWGQRRVPALRRAHVRGLQGILQGTHAHMYYSFIDFVISVYWVSGVRALTAVATMKNICSVVFYV